MKKIITTLLMVLFAAVLFAETNISAPTLVLPANGGVNLAPNALLDWGAVTGAWTYKIEISTDSNFTSPITMTTPNTAISNSELDFGTTYYWHVKAIGFTDSSAWSARWSFTTIDQVTVTTPADSSINHLIKCNIVWAAITGVTGYEWEMDSSATFSSSLYRRGTVGDVTTTIAHKLNFGQTYLLRMRVMHSMDTSSWSTPIMFTSIDTIALKRPVDNYDTAHMVSLEMRWGFIGSSFYDIGFSFDSLFSNPQIVSVDSLSIKTNPAGTVIYYALGQSPILYFDTTYYWSVRGCHNYDTSAWMTPWSFKTIDKVTLESPADAATAVSTVPQLKWKSITGSSLYFIEYDTSALFTNPVQHMRYADTVTYDIDEELEAFTTYYWRVSSMTSIDTSMWSDVWSFTTGSGIGMNETAEKDQFSIYPNPCTGRLNIDIQSYGNGQATVKLSNILGQEVLLHEISLKSGSNNHQLNLSNLTNGIYLVNIQTDNNSITRKVILDR